MAMLDGLTGAPPKAIALALYEQEPPSVLSRHDPVLGRYASMLIQARGAAGDDYYIPKIAQVTARTIGMSLGHDSVEFDRATAIIRRARHNRANRVRQSTVDRAVNRLERRRGRRGAADPRTLAAAGRLRRLRLRAGRDDLAVREFEALVQDLDNVGFEFLDFADDFAEVGEMDLAVLMADRARRWFTEHPASEHTAMHVDAMLFDHCRAAGLADRCREIAAAMAARVRAHPEIAEGYLREVHQAEGRVALMRHDCRAAVGRLGQALDDPDPDKLAFATRSLRNDLLFALASAPGTPIPGSEQ